MLLIRNEMRWPSVSRRLRTRTCNCSDIMGLLKLEPLPTLKGAQHLLYTPALVQGGACCSGMFCRIDCIIWRIFFSFLLPSVCMCIYTVEKKNIKVLASLIIVRRMEGPLRVVLHRRQCIQDALNNVQNKYIVLWQALGVVA